jgi:hypothetical protein
MSSGGAALVDHTDEGNRDLDIGKEIDGEALERSDAQDDHCEGQHQDADPVPEREKSQPHTEEFGDVLI